MPAIAHPSDRLARLTRDDKTLGRLREAANQARSASWAPYTSFAVFAAVLTTDDRDFGGTNIENANISLSRHAEEVAVINALLRGALPAGDDLERRRCIRALYTTAAPCGSCRQFVWEFATEDCVVFIDDVPDSDPAPVALADLYPRPFGPHDQEPLLARNLGR